MRDWVEIAVAVEAAAAEDVAALLADRVPGASAGLELRDGEVVWWVPVEEAEAAAAATRSAVAELAAAGWPVDLAGVRARPAAPEAEWRDAWKRYFHIIRLTERIVIVPSWERYEPAAGDVVIHLDPGQAFGTGAHASTQLCLDELDALAAGGAPVRRFLDVGSGSGILAIAAAKLWPAATGLSIDVDPIAVTTALENCAKNQVSGRIVCSDTPLPEVAGRFDLVLANIQADVLLDLRPLLTGAVASGGRLVLSGLLAGQLDAVAAAYEEAGLALVRRRPSERDPEWGALLLRRDGE
jgi:ribosomal protein L11 methyltransferase